VKVSVDDMAAVTGDQTGATGAVRCRVSISAGSGGALGSKVGVRVDAHFLS
jgi:hypothetical protein